MINEKDTCIIQHRTFSVIEQTLNVNGKAQQFSRLVKVMLPDKSDCDVIAMAPPTFLIAHVQNIPSEVNQPVMAYIFY